VNRKEGRRKRRRRRRRRKGRVAHLAEGSWLPSLVWLRMV